MQKQTTGRLAGKWMVSAIMVASLFATSLADIRITRRIAWGNQGYETITFLKGARQRTETRRYINFPKKPPESAYVAQCDLKRMIWIDLTNKRFTIDTGVTPIGAAMAFNEPQLRGNPPKGRRTSDDARRRLLTKTTTVIDTGERREMFGFTARHLKTITVWEASPKICDGPGMTAKTDGWYTDLFYGIDCSADLSGSITQTTLTGSGKCFSEYAVKRRYWLEHKRIGPASLGYPLLETRTSYNDKGEEQVVTEEVLEISTAALDASLFDEPAGFTLFDFNHRSFFRRLVSFVGR